jgi:phage repressor protein C with HTH and peptisase S24 domain
VGIVLQEWIRKARSHAGLTQEELAEKIGRKQLAISRWERGERKPGGEDLLRIAAVTQYPLPEGDNQTQSIGLMTGNSVRDITPSRGTVRVPVLSRAAIACAGFGNGGMDGIISEAEEYLDLPIEIVGAISIDADKKPYIITVEGDSMEEADIADGSQVIINPAEPVYDGDAALVCFGVRNELAVKWVYWLKDGGMEIRSASLRYPPRAFDKEEVELGMCKIRGKIMQSMKKPKRGA